MNASWNAEHDGELMRGIVEGEPGDEKVQTRQAVLSRTLNEDMSTLMHPKAWSTTMQGKLGAHWRNKFGKPLGTVQE